MTIGFIVQRYGMEILGGSEYHCRMIAERMATRHQVEVLTTTARDYQTWLNEYEEGTDRVRGVVVRRFTVSEPRDLAAFNRYSDWIFNFPHTRADELDWLRQQGPWSPGLLEYLERNQSSYDVLIFFTYLYAPTVLGLKINPAKSILVPTAHDEPAIRLDIYKELFELPAAIAYNTVVERRFLNQLFTIKAPGEIVGCGVDFPQVGFPRAENGGSSASSGSSGTDAEEGGEEASPRENRSYVTSRGAAFRRRHRLFGPMLLYGGRIEPGKGCEELIEYFGAYVREGGDGSLVLMGVKLMPLPEDPSIRFAGLLSDQERLQALEAASVVVVPSPYESLSLLALEAFAVGTPILANARSEVLVEHCRSSNAGLYYGDRDEFVECAKFLLGAGRIRASMGNNGRDYVRRNYRWDVILGKYDRLTAQVRR